MSAIDKYTDPDHPLTIQQHVIIRAIRNLNELEALALIRGAYAHDDGSWATLDEARQVYAAIVRDGHIAKRSSLFNSMPLTCAECRDIMDAAAGYVLEGQPLEQAMPGVALHIAGCAECRQELDALVWVLRAAGQSKLEQRCTPLESSGLQG